MDGRRGGHSKGKHGTQVSPQQHEDRLRTGRDPQTGQIPVDVHGNPKPAPPRSGGFDSNEKHLEALGKSDTKLKTECINSKGGYKKKVELEVDVEDAGSSYELNSSGTMSPTKVNKVKAVYKLVNATTGEYELVTLYPTK